MPVFLNDFRKGASSTGRRRRPGAAGHARISGLSHEGRGIARVDGKTVFLDGALPGETVRFRYLRHGGSFDEGEVMEVETEGAGRTEPPCPYFADCGGCSLQHMDPGYQLRHKEEVLLDHLRRSAGVEPGSMLPPLEGPVYGYRRKARLSVRYLARKGRAVAGFRERRGSQITDLDRCEVLHPAAAALLPVLGSLVGGLSVRRHVPQIEIAVDETGCGLVFRHLRPLTADDMEKLRSFERLHGIRVFLQPGSDRTVHPLNDGAAEHFHYRLDDFDLDLQFLPVDFTQVNFDINAKMVDRVVDLLQPTGLDDVLDLFCGLGNFTLPLARRARSATGVEGNPALVERARDNASRNGIGNAVFNAADLQHIGQGADILRRRYHKVLVDPPRTGALDAIRELDLAGTSHFAYVSCNPATLARDAAILVNDKDFVLSAAGVIDMFPHTSHVESVALFENPRSAAFS